MQSNLKDSIKIPDVMDDTCVLYSNTGDILMHASTESMSPASEMHALEIRTTRTQNQKRHSSYNPSTRNLALEAQAHECTTISSCIVFHFFAL